MDRPLRLATAVTFTSLLGAAILVALRDISSTRVQLGATGGVQTTLSEPLFIATLVLLSLGLGYLVAAAMFAQRWLALVSVLLVTGLIAWKTGLLGIAGLLAVLPDWARWLSWILLVLIWILTLAVLARRRTSPVDSSRMRLIVLTASCALVGAFFLVMWLASPTIGGLSVFPLSIHSLMGDVSLLALPLLQIAAVDFAEWGQLSGRRLSSIPISGAARRVPWRTFLLPALLCVALVVAGWSMLPGTTLQQFTVVGEGVLVLTVAVVVFLAIGRLLRVSTIRWPRSLNIAILFVVLAVTTWAGGTATAALSGGLAVAPQPSVSAHGDYTAAANVRSYTGGSKFTVLIQRGWLAETKNSVDVISSAFPPGTATLMTATAIPQMITAPEFAAALKLEPQGAPHQDGHWLRLNVIPKGGGQAAVWTAPLPESGHSFVFYGVATGPAPGVRIRELEAIVRSFEPAGTPAATLKSMITSPDTGATAPTTPQRQNDLVQTISIGFDLLVTLLALALLLIFGRRWHVGVRAGVLLYAVVTGFTIMSFSDSAIRYLLGPGPIWPGLGEARLLIGIGLLGLSALAAATHTVAPWTVRLPTALAGLAGAALVLYAMDLLYTAALNASHIAAWAAIIILVGIGWDITMSGESLTNGSSKRFPRSTRVIAFFGNAILLAGTIVYYSGQYSAVSNTQLSESFFEPEAITQAALFRFALPLMVLLFLLQLFGRSGQPKAKDVSPTRDPTYSTTRPRRG